MLVRFLRAAILVCAVSGAASASGALPFITVDERERSLSALAEDFGGLAIGMPTVRNPDSFLAPFNGGEKFDNLATPAGASVANSLVTQNSSLFGDPTFFSLGFDGLADVSGMTDIDGIRAEAAAESYFRVQFTLPQPLEYLLIGELIQVGSGAIAELEFRQIGGPTIVAETGNAVFQLSDTLPAGDYEIRAMASASGSITDSDSFDYTAEFNNFGLVFFPEPCSALLLIVGSVTVLRRKESGVQMMR